jgi:sterol desaturase/sphingolipid hydroxylase (fatty acid hydroxylase superfamily)
MEAFVFFVVLLVGLGIPFGYMMFKRDREHKVTMAMIEKGIFEAPQPVTKPKNGKNTLRWGIVVSFLGLALTLGLYPFGAMVTEVEFPLGFGPWMLIGLIPMFFGLSLIVVYYVTREDDDNKAEQED